MQTFILFAVIAGALALFATEKLRADLIAVLVTGVLALTGLITVEEAFAGFSNPAVITVAAVFVLSAGLLRTGGAEHLTNALRVLGGKTPGRMILAVVLLVGFLSSFMNNIGATILLMPAVIAVAREVPMPSRQLLLPLAFGSLLGGLTTLIGTPPNLLISATLTEHGYAPFGLFSFAPVGLLVLFVGALFLVAATPRLLPQSGASKGKTNAAGSDPDGASLADDAHGAAGVLGVQGMDGVQEMDGPKGMEGAGGPQSPVGVFPGRNEEVSSEVLLEPPPSTLEQAGQIVSRFGLRVLAVWAPAQASPQTPGRASDQAPERAGQSRQRTAPEARAIDASPGTDEAGAQAAAAYDEVAATAEDPLLVAGARDNLLRAAATRKLRILAEIKHPPNGLDGNGGDEVSLAEATLAPRSSLAGKTLTELDFYNRYGLTVIGIRRHGESIRQPLSELRLRFGDTLLLRGPRPRIHALVPDGDFLLLEPIEHRVPNYHRLTRAVVILASVLIAAATGLLHIALATVLGAAAMVLAGCLRSEEVHRSIDWRTVIAIGGMIPLSTALETTGAAEAIALFLTGIGAGHGPYFACALLGVATVILTQIMTNAAAAILVAPIGIGVAQALGVSPHPILMIVAVAASTAFITPIGHQSNILVYNAGGYRFWDFVRIGLPLTAITLTVALLLVPRLWPF